MWSSPLTPALSGLTSQVAALVLLVAVACPSEEEEDEADDGGDQDSDKEFDRDGAHRVTSRPKRSTSRTTRTDRALILSPTTTASDISTRHSTKRVAAA